MNVLALCNSVDNNDMATAECLYALSRLAEQEVCKYHVHVRLIGITQLPKGLDGYMVKW